MTKSPPAPNRQKILTRVFICVAVYFLIGFLIHLFQYRMVYQDRLFFDLVFWPVFTLVLGLDRIGIITIPQW